MWPPSLLWYGLRVRGKAPQVTRAGSLDCRAMLSERDRCVIEDSQPWPTGRPDSLGGSHKQLPDLCMRTHTTTCFYALTIILLREVSFSAWELWEGTSFLFSFADFNFHYPTARCPYDSNEARPTLQRISIHYFFSLHHLHTKPCCQTQAIRFAEQFGILTCMWKGDSITGALHIRVKWGHLAASVCSPTVYLRQRSMGLILFHWLSITFLWVPSFPTSQQPLTHYRAG